MLYTVTGEGKAQVFQNGDIMEATWEKAQATDMLRFFADDGEEISLVRGQTWIEVLPLGNEVKY